MSDWVDFLAYWLLKGGVALFVLLPARPVYVVASFLGQCFFYCSGRRHKAYADLKAAFGTGLTERDRWRILRAHYAHLGQTAAEIVRFPLLNRRFIENNVGIHHPERFHNLIKEGRGVILLTAHFGNWELLQIVSGILGKPIHVLARNQKYKRLNQLLIKLRESHGSVAVSRGMGIRDLLRALRRKELVGVVGDQDAGKEGGVIVPFFGRKTTVPTGAFELACRSGAPVLPCFIIRHKDSYHEVYVGEPIRCAQIDYEQKDLKPYVETFVAILEHFIRRFPSQWLWSAKRWKHSWTKRLLILSDQKPGHVKQSQAVAAQIQSLDSQYGRPGMEYLTKTLEVCFKSKWHQKIFPFVAFLFMPWVQGRLHWLSPFFTKETADQIRAASADFVISSGASLIPLNLCLAKESQAKTIVLMKPSFPFNFFRYDLAVIPAHDRGKMPPETFRTLLTPSDLNVEDLQEAAAVLKKDLREASLVKLAVFLGGPTRRYQMDLADIEKTVHVLEKISDRVGDYLLTTSRRTPEAICQFLKQKSNLQACQLLVIAAEDKRSDVVNGMMALADILIVTEDSISMISEAVSSGKKVIVLSFGTEGLPDKHRRFREILAASSAVVVASCENLEEKILNVDQYLRPGLAAQEENEALRKRLQAIL